MYYKGFSGSLKRATVVLTLPGVGRTTVQEDDGKVDEDLRRIIKKLRKILEREWTYYEAASGGGKGPTTTAPQISESAAK